MTRTVYVNGEYLPEDQAKVSIFRPRLPLCRRQSYEVTSVLGGKLIDFAGHAKRPPALARRVSRWPTP